MGLSFGASGLVVFGALGSVLLGGRPAGAQITIRTTTATPNVRDPREICATEEFRPQCSSSEHDVIMITDAEYGRMAFGECVQKDYGYLGCSTRVLDLMDGFCSGRRACSVTVPETRLEAVNPCPSEFKAYLNVSYECIEVEKTACNSCNPLSRSNVAKITKPRGFIGSVATLESPSGVCGSAQCPWYIEVQSGQTINLTLYDFSNKQALAAGTSPGQCSRLAVIKEAAHLKETPICYRQNRIQPIYSSVSQSIQIHVVSKGVLEAKGQFLIQFEVTGCPDLHPPENAWLKRMGDRVIVGCHDTSHGLRWESRCVDSRWEGEIGTCPGFALQTTIAPSLLTLPLGVLVAIVLGIALVIGVFIVTVGVVCLKRQQSDVLSRTANVLYTPAGQCYELRENYPTTSHHHSASSSSCDRKTSSRSSEHRGGGSLKAQHPGRRNVYAHTRMETRPLPSLPNLNEVSTSTDQGLVRVGRVLHAVELGPHGDPYPYHLRASTLGRTAQRPTKKGSRRRDDHRSGTCSGPMRPNIPTASGPCSSGAAAFSCPGPSSSVPQHYTVLDPIEVQQQLTGTLRAGRSVPVASPQGQQQQGVSGASPGMTTLDRGRRRAETSDSSPPPPKPPLLPSVMVCQGAVGGRCGEGGIEKASCREITLRPTRQHSSRNRTNDDVPSSGNSSWP